MYNLTHTHSSGNIYKRAGAPESVILKILSWPMLLLCLAFGLLAVLALSLSLSRADSHVYIQMTAVVYMRRIYTILERETTTILLHHYYLL